MIYIVVLINFKTNKFIKMLSITDEYAKVYSYQWRHRIRENVKEPTKIGFG